MNTQKSHLTLVIFLFVKIYALVSNNNALWSVRDGKEMWYLKSLITLHRAGKMKPLILCVRLIWQWLDFDKKVTFIKKSSRYYWRFNFVLKFCWANAYFKNKKVFMEIVHFATQKKQSEILFLSHLSIKVNVIFVIISGSLKGFE